MGQFYSKLKVPRLTVVLASLVLLIFVVIYQKNGNQNVTIEMINSSNNAETSATVELQDGEIFDLDAELVTKKLYGLELSMLGYNGSIPGPTIKVKQGSTVTLHFTNNTPFENTIHSHGVRMDNAFDGIPNVTQAPVQPGESFDYILTFPDPGVYWYHPHMREDLTQELGLYGAFVVEPIERGYWNEVNQEQLIFLDDLLLTEGGLESFYSDEITHTLMGRYGNAFLTNGEEQLELEVMKNEIVRFTLINVANARPFNFELAGMSLKLVGSDGGAYEQETFVDSIIIGPSERYIFEAYFDEPGDYELQNVTPSGSTKLGIIHVLEEETQNDLGKAFTELRENSHIQNFIPNLANYYSKEADKKLRLNIEMGMMGGGGMMDHGMTGMPCHQMGDGSWMGDCEATKDELSGIEWEDSMSMMNAMMNDDSVEWQIIDEVTGDINDEIEWDFDLDEFVVIEIKNDENSDHPMQHPIHFHGQRFVILEEDGTQNTNLVWKDTVMIPTGATYKILLEVSNPGQWMAHCHIAEHLHNGMMFMFGVELNP